MFKDRKDAGEKLAKALEKYRAENPLVLAIPRGVLKLGFGLPGTWVRLFPSS
ncbi:hypothetical protein [Methanosarcina sp. KYL-1]|uniref:hypothetical protein n=1 Tax=Methanosarcina sp. KYL-1 TaxID=2602068 RepID=UPI002100E67B|nr:hypothetical protein [Methanosarcina sp. KYL-1]